LGKIREREMLLVFWRKAELKWKLYAALQSSAPGSAHFEEVE
jgi:hypothetical protein